MPEENPRTTSTAEELAQLQLEKESLAQQVKRLIKAESRLYEYQEELDAQLLEYKELYEISRKLNATLHMGRIFELSCAYVIRNLQYERVIFLQQSSPGGRYVVCALDGYYEPQEEAVARGLSIGEDDPLLMPLLAGAEYLICQAGSTDEALARCRASFLMDEYLLYPIGFHDRPLALLAVGNSAANAEFYHRINDREGTLLGMGNLAGLLSSAVENRTFYANMEQALQQERLAEAKYRGIFENALEGIYQTRGGRFISCNPATAAILGYDSPEDLMESITDIGRQLYVHPERRQHLFDLMQQGVNVKHFEVEFYRKDGSRRWVLLSTRPVFDENEEILHVDGLIQDIAERKLAEEAIQELNEELEQRVIERTRELETANLGLRQVTGELEGAYSELKSAQSQILQQEKMASIGQLAAGVAHEINNPMGFIISNLNSLGKYTERIASYVQLQAAAIEELSNAAGSHAQEQELLSRKKSMKMDYIMGDLGNLLRESLDGAERVRRIVQDLKGFSRLDEAEFKAADINEGLESTINIVWSELKQKATLTREYGDIPRTLCNLGQLNQVFMNILVNAVHAMESLGEIRVRTWSEDGKIHVTISDTGQGIPADRLDRIFEPFYTTKEVGKGTGLGLSIAYDIVKKHNGELRVASQVGKGTTFTMVLPIVTGDETVGPPGGNPAGS